MDRQKFSRMMDLSERMYLADLREGMSVKCRVGSKASLLRSRFAQLPP